MSNIITRRVQIVPQSDDAWQFIRDLNYQVWKAANRIVSIQHNNDELQKRLRANGLSAKEANSILTDHFGTSTQNTSYRLIRSEFPEISSYVASALNAQVFSVYRSERADVSRGNRSIRSYRRNMPIPVVSRGLIVSDDCDSITFCGHSFSINYGRDRSNNRAIVERIVSGQYKLCDSSLMIRKKKLFANLVVRLPEEKVPLDPEKVVGVNLGIRVPAYLAANTGPARKAIGSIDDLLRVRLRIQEQRRELQRNLVFNKGGKGRKKKLARLDKLGTRERNVVKNVNHEISKQVVQFALKENAATIHIEDLSGFGKNGGAKEEFFLRNWSYFELQQYISYKAKRAGIEVVTVPCYYHSQTCAACGHQDETQYDIAAGVFTCGNKDCKKYGKKVHGDYNAALNAARWKK